MSLDMHVEALTEKHASIDETIEKEEHRPYPDALRLMLLKRKKLKLKDELGKLATHH